MGYKLLYPSFRKNKIIPGSQIRLPLLSALCFLIFLSVVCMQWQEGAALIYAGVQRIRAVFTDMDLAAEAFLSDASLSEALSDTISFLKSVQD